MSRSLGWISPAFVLLCLLSFSCNENVTYPPQQYPINLLTNPSFERNGKLFLSGWMVFDSNYIHLSTDIPEGKHGYSLVVDNYVDTAYGSGPPPLLHQIVPLPYGPHVYRLSFWSKDVPTEIPAWNDVVLFASVGDTAITKSLDISFWDTTWTFHSLLSDSWTINQSGTLGLYIGEPQADTIGAKTCFFDIKLEIMN